MKEITISNDIIVHAASTDASVQPDADGTYTITNGNHTVSVHPPFVVESANSYEAYNLYLNDSNQIFYIYRLHDDTTEEEYFNKNHIDDTTETTIRTDIINENVKTLEVNGLKINYFTYASTWNNESRSKTYYAYTQMGQDLFEIKVKLDWPID